MRGLLLSMLIVVGVLMLSGRRLRIKIPSWAPSALVRWHARRRFRAATRDYRRWMREANFVYKALGEPSDEWHHAVIEQARAEREMNLWAIRAWPDESAATIERQNREASL